MAKVELTNLYDMNKQLMEKAPALNKGDVHNALVQIKKHIWNISGWVMLLCHERRDYTVFDKTANDDDDIFTDALYECLTNRGEILSIERTEDKQAFEIWLRIEGQPYCYYIFKYDDGVIMCYHG